MWGMCISQEKLFEVYYMQVGRQRTLKNTYIPFDVKPRDSGVTSSSGRSEANISEK